MDVLHGPPSFSQPPLDVRIENGLVALRRRPIYAAGPRKQ